MSILSVSLDLNFLKQLVSVPAFPLDFPVLRVPVKYSVETLIAQQIGSFKP